MNHRVDRVKHTFITWETNSVEKNNINKTFSIGLSNITSMLLHFFMFLDKAKVGRGKKNPKGYHSSNFSQCSKEFRSIETLLDNLDNCTLITNKTNNFCQTESSKQA